ncbi:MAG: hypothetical protein LBS86_06800, partial [Treponema sp.]|nr:hypothetical protein [Treponema sp.]
IEIDDPLAIAVSDYVNEINEAMRRGEKRGEERGEQNMAIAIARNMKRGGYPAGEIARMTGLSLEQIEQAEWAS